MADNPLPLAAVVIQSTVADFDAWKATFDGAEDLRRSGAVIGHHINRSTDDPNRIAVYFASSDEEATRAWSTSDELREVMRKAGVQAPPEMLWMTPLREDIVWDRELPAAIISHPVADVATWLAGYDAAADFRDDAGIVGHAVNQSMDDPSVVVVYHQAETSEALDAFLSSPDLQERMQSLGVTAPPEISHYIGGWGKQYT